MCKIYNFHINRFCCGKHFWKICKSSGWLLQFPSKSQTTTLKIRSGWSQILMKTAFHLFMIQWQGQSLCYYLNENNKVIYTLYSLELNYRVNLAVYVLINMTKHNIWLSADVVQHNINYCYKISSFHSKGPKSPRNEMKTYFVWFCCSEKHVVAFPFYHFARKRRRTLFRGCENSYAIICVLLIICP